MQTHPDFTALFRDAIKGNNEYYEALSIARMNMQGRLWVAGGFVFRTLAARLYGGARQPTDIDFLGEQLTEKLIIPAGWQVTRNIFGNPKLVCGEQSPDIVPLDNLFLPENKKRPQTIATYLDTVSLTIQSIVYDVAAKRIMGARGIKALQEKTVGVLNLHRLIRYCELKDLTPVEYIRKKAASLGFTAVIPPDLL